MSGGASNISERPAANSPRGWADLAHNAERGGDPEAAITLVREGLATFPGSAELWNAAANIYKRQGLSDEAAKAFGEAAKQAPGSMEYAINHAIALGDVNEAGRALAVLDAFADEGGASARYCTVRGNTERLAGCKAEAARWYNLALAIEPRRPKALAGRAFVAIDRVEADVVARFDAALAVDQANPDLWLGKAQALELGGDVSAARAIADAIATQGPHWAPGQEYLAELRLAAGEDDFAGHYEIAYQKVPTDPNILFEWSRVLAGNSHYADAAEIAARGRVAFPDQARFALLEAIRSGEAGDDERAEALFAEIESDSSDRWLHEGRHRIRRGEIDRADQVLQRALELDPWSVAGWALRGIVWRLQDDPRKEWLHEQAELVRLLPLDEGGNADTESSGAQGGGLLPRVVPTLHRIHDNSAFPLGQSLRGGTQTRGIIFDRTESELAELRAAILRTVNGYRETLAEHDPTHPILRLRDQEWSLAGSWSVRLGAGGDHHASHIHPQGIISSALYLELPDFETEGPKAGWLEIGRPPKDLRLDLEPIREIQPKAGHMALFPSTLYHGTRPFSEGQRMTVAFDVCLA